MTKEEKVLKVIREIDNLEAVNIYFDWNSYLIEKLNLSDDDPRFIINVRYDRHKRFSTNINSRLVWGLGIVDYEPIIMVMIYQRQIDLINEYESLEYFKGNTEKAYLVYMTFDQFKPQADIIKNLWINCCKEYLPVEKGSRFKHSHLPLLYDASKDKEIRKEILSKKN